MKHYMTKQVKNHKDGKQFEQNLKSLHVRASQEHEGGKEFEQNLEYAYIYSQL